MATQTEILLGPIRIGILLTLFVGFYFLDGFSFPDGAAAPRQRAWLLSIGLFGGGAFIATCVDVTVGLMDRSSLRVLCIVGGVLLLGAGLLVQHVIREAALDPLPASVALKSEWGKGGVQPESRRTDRQLDVGSRLAQTTV
jgi:hypothetical protein